MDCLSLLSSQPPELNGLSRIEFGLDLFYIVMAIIGFVIAHKRMPRPTRKYAEEIIMRAFAFSAGLTILYGLVHDPRIFYVMATEQNLHLYAAGLTGFLYPLLHWFYPTDYA